MAAASPVTTTGPMTGPAGDYVPEGQYVTYGQGRPGACPAAGRLPGGPAARAVPDGDRGGAWVRRHARRSGRTGTAGRGRADPESCDGRASRDAPVSAPGPEAGAAESGLQAGAAGPRPPPRLRGRTAGS